MVIELSNLMFSDQADVVPASGVERIFNIGIANMLAGDDIITGSSTSRRTGFSMDDGAVIYNIGTINTGNGNDTIIGIRDQIEENSYGSAIFNDRGTIDTGEGNDMITGISQKDTETNSQAGRGIRSIYATINTGDGSDKIRGMGMTTGISLESSGSLDTGKGNDIIIGTGGKNGSGIYNEYNVSIDTSDGDDIITGNSMGVGHGISNEGTINTGNDNDIIIASTAIDGASIFNSRYGIIDTGDGNDIIIGISIAGIYNAGTINTGNGNDSIISEAGLDGIGDLFLGDGKDYLKSFGNSSFNSGNGEDTLELTSGSYIIEISETTVNLIKGSEIMRTSNFEKLIAGNIAYNFSGLTNGQTIVVA
jgi:hypothetical protein